MSDLFYRYANSHLYDIYAALAGTLVFLCMLVIKKPIKRLTAEKAKKHFLRNAGGVQDTKNVKAADNDREAEGVCEAGSAKNVRAADSILKEYVYRRRLNMVLPFLTEALGVVFFYGCARLGGQVEFSWGSALLAGVIAMAEYAFVEQVV